MKDFVEKLKQKYPKIIYGEKPYFNPDIYLFQKYAYRVPKGWYGFSLGEEVPFVWAKIIEEFLDELEKHCPNYEIYQIKLKMGGLRFYISLNNPLIGGRIETVKKEIQEEINKLQNWLFSDSLIY